MVEPPARKSTDSASPASEGASHDVFGAVRQRFYAGAWTQTLGVEILNLGAGEAAIGLVVPSSLLQAQGVLQGGFLGVLADAATSTAVMTVLETPTQRLVTVEMKVSFLSPARQGDHLRAEGRVIQRSRRLAFTEAKVIGPAGTMVALATATFLLYPAEPGR